MEDSKYTRGQLKIDFNPTQCCEIKVKDKWFRVTATEFRSFSGERRILNVKDPSNPVYEKYTGPVYTFGTNKTSKSPTPNKIQFIDHKDPRTKYNERKYN
jgi:hypothetical protein